MNTKNFRLLLAATAVMALILIPGCDKNDQKDENAGPFYGSVTDTEGNVYKTVEIGWGEWMAENLRTTRYNDGTPIPTGLDPDEWSNTEEGAYAVYQHERVDGLDSDEEVISAYGLHYNWYAVETGNLCPPGWRVPSAEDWDGLLFYLIDNYDEINNDNAGDFLKSCRQVDSPLGGDCNTILHPRWNKDGVNYFWEEWEQMFPDNEFPNRPDIEFESAPLAGTDEFGFSALPAGQYSSFGFGIGYICNYWTSGYDFPIRNEYITEREKAPAYLLQPGLYYLQSKTTGFPLRCVRGELPERVPRYREP